MHQTKEDQYDRITKLLWLGRKQADIAEEIGVSTGTVSNYHQELEESEGVKYFEIRKRNKKLDKAGVEFSEVEDTLEAVVSVMEQEGLAPHLSVQDAAKVISLASRFYDENADKHDVAVKMGELVAVFEGLEIELHQVLDDPEILREQIQDSVPEKRTRTMSEARKQKGAKLLEISRH